MVSCNLSRSQNVNNKNMTSERLDELRNELSVKSKNGINFTLAASIIWFVILPGTGFEKLLL